MKGMTWSMIKNHCSKILAVLSTCCLFAIPTQVAAQGGSSNLLHIAEGTIALPDGDEIDTQWRGFTINLLDGSDNYGWVSREGIAAPHRIDFELAQLSLIEAVALSSTFEAITAYDGELVQSGAGVGPARRFRILYSSSLEGDDFQILLEDELAPSSDMKFEFASAATVRRLRLELLSNWDDMPRTRLSEIRAFGTRLELDAGPDFDINGIYEHNYGPIVLRRNGNLVEGCYLDGRGLLNGVMNGRVLRLAYLEREDSRMGTALFVAAHEKLFGFWFGSRNEMGSPWNAPKIGSLAADLGGCK